MGLIAPELLTSTSVTKSGEGSINVIKGAVSKTTTTIPAALGAALQQLLLERHLAEPLIIAVDEAHALAPEVARRLINLAQNLIVDNVPVWLILAGTPGLKTHLMSNEVNASFIERAKQMYPGLLSDSAAREALVTPLTTRGWTVDEAALETVLRGAQGYPFFLQLWGEGRVGGRFRPPGCGCGFRREGREIGERDTREFL